MSYVKTKREGVFHNPKTGKYLARITLEGKQHKQTFDREFPAIQWRLAMEKGEKIPETKEKETSTLRSVWEEMQASHFPTLATSTIDIWHRRYELLKQLEHLSMGEINSSKMSSWVEENVAHFRSAEYEDSCRGQAKRCNLDNELNLFVTIFNWYKQSEKFEAEAVNLPNPVKTRHKSMGFIRAKPIKDKAITLEAALQFFSHLKPLYFDLARFQYLTASRIGEVAGLQWSRLDLKNRKGIIMETCVWCNTSKTFVELKKFPKNRDPRPFYITDELMEIFERRLAFKALSSDYVFHIEGQPLNYCTIQVNFREAQRKSGVPYRGTHILRHGMAKLARKVGGGLDAVIAVTGHKDFKLADHYSKLDGDYQKEIALKIAEYMRNNPLEEKVLEFKREATAP